MSLRTANFLGGVWPVVQRELREGARRPFNYWLRVGAGAAGLLMVVYRTHGRNVGDKEMGGVLFGELHLLLMGLICLAVPWMTADCIAGEKREGTLGLLFLTPLTPGGIVAGKGLAQALRALTLWVSAAPMLTIPFLIGGVAWEDATAALALEFSALVLCLAAGLLASTLVRARGAAFVLALLLGALFVSMFFRLTCFCFAAQTAWITEWGVVDAFYRGGIPPNISFGPSLMSRSAFANALAAVSHVWHLDLWASPIPASLIFVLVLRFAAWRMAGAWQDKVTSPSQESLMRKYCRPVFQRWFARRTRRKLDRNPIAWLQQYSWKARLGKWLLCLAFAVITTGETIFWPNDPDVGETTWRLLVLIMAAGMTFAGINSFAQEKRSGALELILITPISVNQIISGRVLGVWKQFLPAALLLAGFDVAINWIGGDLKFGRLFDSRIFDFESDYFPDRLLVVCGFISLPVIALYFALRVKNLVVAAGMAWAVLFLPYLFIVLSARALQLQMVIRELDDIPAIMISVAWSLGILALALVACFLLRHSLSRRIYSF